jgi:hypothetical protein
MVSLATNLTSNQRHGRNRTRSMSHRTPAPPPHVHETSRPRWHFVLFAVVLMALAGEILASWYFARYGQRLAFPDPQRFTATPEEAARVQWLFDADVGWRPRYATPFGERPRSRHVGRPLVAAFGDSFTHGDEVEDHETWSEALAERLGGDVFNFGVGGFGLDQTLLRFEREAAKRPTEIAIFAFISLDLDRCFGTYFKFQQPAGYPITKPRFVVEHDALVLVPNPFTHAEALAERVQDPAFIAELGRHDRWYNPYGLPALTRPYLVRLADPRIWRAALASRTVPDSWNEPDAVRLAELILLRFHTRSLALGIRPVIVHLPLHTEVTAFLRDGTIPPAIERLGALCRFHRLTCWTPLRAVEARAEETWSWFTRGRDGGHYSARGNRWIADFLAPKVEWLLVPKATTEAPKHPSP